MDDNKHKFGHHSNAVIQENTLGYIIFQAVTILAWREMS